MRIVHDSDQERYQDIVPAPEPPRRWEWVLWGLLIACLLAIGMLGTVHLWGPVVDTLGR